MFQQVLKRLKRRLKLEDAGHFKLLDQRQPQDDGLPHVERHPESAPQLLNPETSTPADVNMEARSNETINNNDPILQSNHKIFLSHSGAQKDFVEQLCEDLEKRYHFPFFDRRPSSLPKGERFPELILKATKQCEMAVVVISEEYFLSKWPMIELHAFVQARLTSNTNLKILPLFYGLSVKEFTNEKRRLHWFKKWEDWAKIDSRINFKEWKESLKVLASFNGIEYNPDSRGVQAYRENIVSNICLEIPSDIKWDDSHVQGRSKLCKEIRQRIHEGLSLPHYKVHVVGFYGIGGIGKTTLCKTMCNEMSQEFKGKVSHIELGNRSSEELLREGLEGLTNTSRVLLQRLNEGECKYILNNGMCKQKAFLAIDNVLDDSKSIEQAKMYLQANFHDGSVVMVTSRTLATLTYLGINTSACFEIPELEREDAKNLLLHHAAYGTKFSNYQDELIVDECVALCNFRKDNKRGYHYVPIALKALGTQLSYIGNKPLEWSKTLPKIKANFNILKEEHNPVFSIMRSSFDRIQDPNDQDLFIDVVLFTPDWEIMGPMEWLSYVYNQDLQEIQDQLKFLKERGLLEDVNMASQRIIVHDLYREFAKMEASGKLNMGADFHTRRYGYYKNTFPTELEMTPSYRCWQNLRRIRILEYPCCKRNLESLQGIEWGNCTNVVVLKLERLHKLRGDLNLTGLKCLRSLELFEINHLDTLDGLQNLKNLICFRWVQFVAMDMTVHTVMKHLPSSLKFLQLKIGVFLKSDVFALCKHLIKVDLEDCHVENNLDFSNCTSLQTLRLFDLQLLKTLFGITSTTISSLQSLIVSGCNDLVEIPRFGHTGGFKQLKVVDFSGNKILSSLEGVFENLHALQCLNLSNCESLSRLPNLSELKTLEELDLYNSSIEIREEDICMLATLPLLHPVGVGQSNHLKLDVVKRKVLKWIPECEKYYPPQSWGKWMKWEERDLTMLPIHANDIKVGAPSPTPSLCPLVRN